MLFRAEQQLQDQQLQLAAIMQAINRIGVKRQVDAFSENTSVPHIEIKDCDFGSTMT